MNQQLPLVLRWPGRQRLEHFHPGPNAAACYAVRVLARGDGASWIYLHGPSGSGKSHLLLAACQAASQAGARVQYLPLAMLSDPVSALRGMAGSTVLALDDLDTIAGNSTAEHALFDLYNAVSAEGKSLLFAARATPTQLGLRLPDLCSRLGSCTRFPLKPLSEDQRREVLKKQAAMRSIVLDDGVLNWLFARYARDLCALLDVLDQLDQASLAAQRRLTVPFLRDFLHNPRVDHRG